MDRNKCLIIEELPSNFAVLERLVNSFGLAPINITEPAMVLHYLENRPANLVIIDTDNLNETYAHALTSKVKSLNPQGIIMWVCTRQPAKTSSEEETPDILLTKPLGMRSFQEALVPYLFRISTGVKDKSLN